MNRRKPLKDRQIKCGKVWYASEKEARKALRLIRQGGDWMKPYKCNKCRGWHLTGN